MMKSPQLDVNKFSAMVSNLTKPFVLPARHNTGLVREFSRRRIFTCKFFYGLVNYIVSRHIQFNRYITDQYKADKRMVVREVVDIEGDYVIQLEFRGVFVNVGVSGSIEKLTVVQLREIADTMAYDYVTFVRDPEFTKSRWRERQASRLEKYTPQATAVRRSRL